MKHDLKTKNLRIGNYLQDPEGNIVEVIRLHENGCIEVYSEIHQFHDFMDTDDEILFSAIPLTPAKILNVGFKQGIIQDKFDATIDWWHIIKHDDNYIFRGLGASIVKLENLHHFQNLWHSLTGEELIYNHSNKQN